MWSLLLRHAQSQTLLHLVPLKLYRARSQCQQFWAQLLRPSARNALHRGLLLQLPPLSRSPQAPRLRFPGRAQRLQTFGAPDPLPHHLCPLLLKTLSPLKCKPLQSFKTAYCSWHDFRSILTTLTTCPVTETIASGSSQSIRVTQTLSVIRNTVTSTICTKCVAPPNTQAASSTPASQPSSSPTGPPPAPVPSVLPKCLNTWITLTKCENNADSDCYCRDSEFTKNVQDCVSSWSEDSTVIQAALSYLAGICAPAVKANPGIITNVPSTITLCPNPTPTATSSARLLATAGSITPPVPVSIPVTTISLVKTVTIPISFTTGSSVGQAIPSSFTTSVISTEVIVPQVKFTTDTLPPGVTGSPDVGLVGGVPASVPAYPTTVGRSTFATGRLSTGTRPTVGPSALPFQGGATRTGSGILGALFVGALGLLMGLWRMNGGSKIPKRNNLHDSRLHIRAHLLHCFNVIYAKCKKKGRANTCCIIRYWDHCWYVISWSLMEGEEKSQSLNKYIAVEYIAVV